MALFLKLNCPTSNSHYFWLKLCETEYRNYTFLNTFAKTFELMIFEDLKPQVETIVSNTEKTVNERLLNICELLETHIAYYNWVGFYFRNGDKKELHFCIKIS